MTDWTLQSAEYRAFWWRYLLIALPSAFVVLVAAIVSGLWIAKRIGL